MTTTTYANDQNDLRKWRREPTQMETTIYVNDNDDLGM